MVSFVNWCNAWLTLVNFCIGVRYHNEYKLTINVICIAFHAILHSESPAPLLSVCLYVNVAIHLLQNSINSILKFEKFLLAFKNKNTLCKMTTTILFIMRKEKTSSFPQAKVVSRPRGTYCKHLAIRSKFDALPIPLERLNFNYSFNSRKVGTQ